MKTFRFRAIRLSWRRAGDSNTVDDLEPINPPCSPDFGTGYADCVRRINRAAPQSAAGKQWFPGDYNAVTFLNFVPKTDGTSGWKWATQPTDVPSVGAMSIFADDRNLNPPTYPANIPEYQRYPYYDAPGANQLCTNLGARNTDVFSARVNLGLAVTAPFTWRPTPAEYPLTVWNNTNATRFSCDIQTLRTVGLVKKHRPKGRSFSPRGTVQIAAFSSSLGGLYQ